MKYPLTRNVAILLPVVIGGLLTMHLICFSADWEPLETSKPISGPGELAFRYVAHSLNFLSLASDRGVAVKRLIYYLTVAATLIAAGLRLLFGQTRPALLDSRLVRWVLVLAGGYVLLGILSMLWAHRVDLAWRTAAIAAVDYLWLIGLVLLADLVPLRRWAWAIVIPGAVLGLVALWNILALSKGGRPGFPTGNPLITGACMLTPAFVAGGIMWGKGGKWIIRAMVCVGVIVLSLLILRLTDARSSYVGLAAGVAAGVFFALRSRRLRTAWAILIILAAAGLVVGKGLYRAKNWGRSPTVEFRFIAYKIAADAFWTRPIHGWGAGHYTRRAELKTPQYAWEHPRALVPNHVTNHAHNVFLEIATNLGLTGVILWTAPFVLILTAAAKALGQTTGPPRGLLIGGSAAIVAVLAEECFSIALWFSSLPMMFWMLVAVVLAGLCRDRIMGPVRHSTRVWSKIAGIGVLAASMPVLLLAGRDMLAAVAYRTAWTIYKQSPNEALAILPAATTGRLRDLGYLRARYIEGQCHYFLGNKAAEDGRTEQACESWRTALNIFEDIDDAMPNFWCSRRQAGFALFKLGNPQQAIEKMLSASADEPFDRSLNRPIIHDEQIPFSDAQRFEHLLQSIRGGLGDSIVEDILKTWGRDKQTPGQGDKGKDRLKALAQWNAKRVAGARADLEAKNWKRLARMMIPEVHLVTGRLKILAGGHTPSAYARAVPNFRAAVEMYDHTPNLQVQCRVMAADLLAWTILRADPRKVRTAKELLQKALSWTKVMAPPWLVRRIKLGLAALALTQNDIKTAKKIISDHQKNVPQIAIRRGLSRAWFRLFKQFRKVPAYREKPMVTEALDLAIKWDPKFGEGYRALAARFFEAGEVSAGLRELARAKKYGVSSERVLDTARRAAKKYPDNPVLQQWIDQNRP